MLEDLKGYQAPTFWRMHRDKAWAALAAVLWIMAMLQPSNETLPPAQDQATMPAADPIFEPWYHLLILTPPISCVRPSGIQHVGREWIKQWGDGDLPPLIPDCVRASKS